MEKGADAIRKALELSEELRMAKGRRLRREFPNETQECLELRLQRWWLERPDAPHGDASGPSFRVRTSSP